ncbi:hypothetical protein GCM10020256_02640 [Streptomyces thermocoprophilus]
MTGRDPCRRTRSLPTERGRAGGRPPLCLPGTPTEPPTHRIVPTEPEEAAMNAKVLVAYGSTNGSTARIADAVAAVLDKEGLTAETRPAGSVQDVSPYDAVVIGGGLYAGRWHKDSRRFARRHRQALAERPVWLFSSGPLDPLRR